MPTFLKKTNILWLCLLWLALPSCENDLEEVRKFGYYEEVPTEIARDVEMLYSDSFRVRVRVVSPLLERYGGPYTREEFNEGISVDFIGENLRPNSRLTADKAVKKIMVIKDEKGRSVREPVVVITDNVVLANAAGDTLKTEELVWFENSSQLSTNKFVIISKPDEVIYGYGMDSDKEFSKWRIRSVAGRFLSRRFTNDLAD